MIHIHWLLFWLCISGACLVGMCLSALLGDRKEVKKEWISVKDKLPEMYTAVLVTNNNGVYMDERDPEIAVLHEDGKFYFIATWNFNLHSKATVTHWMPVPKLLS